MISNKLVEFASHNYGFDAATLHFISHSTNEIYKFNKNGKWYILRFSKRPMEQIHQIKAEMDWLYFLSRNGIGVSLPLCSNQGELAVSAAEDNETYIITSFEMVYGQPWDKNDPSRWNEKIFFQWGKVMGDIHRLTKDFTPANHLDTRSTFMPEIPENIKDCSTVCQKLSMLIDEMMTLPKDKDSYGLIHYDIHPWNFYIDGDQINVFDFDDSLYGWFALDIGVALYHALWWGRKDDAKPVPNDFTNRIIEHFLKGYLSANHLSAFWISKIPMFMRYRQICKFSWFYNPENVDDHQKERIYNIEHDILFKDCEIDESLFMISPQ